MKAKIPTWTRTKTQHLYRHKSGRYYARAFVSGKEVWQSLGTTLQSVAEAKLGKFLEHYRGVRRKGKRIGSVKMTFNDAAEIHLRNIDRRIGVKKRTRDYWRETLIALRKSWPTLFEMQLRSITEEELKD